MDAQKASTNLNDRVLKEMVSFDIGRAWQKALLQWFLGGDGGHSSAYWQCILAEHIGGAWQKDLLQWFLQESRGSAYWQCILAEPWQCILEDACRGAVAVHIERCI
eukprot:1154105-Pelagomonas_calceolata.AAC.2